MDTRTGEPLISVDHVRHRFAAREILDDLSLTIHQGDRLGLLGVNGAGKSTLIRVLAGDLVPDGGEVIRKRGLRVGYLPQEFALEAGKTVLESVQEGAADLRARLAAYEELGRQLSGDAKNPDDLIAQQAELAEELERSGAWELDREVVSVMRHLDVPAGDRRVDAISGGERRRVSLARTLVGRPGLLILDEPTNHLDASSIAWLENYLAAYRGSVLLVTHDRYFLDRVANRMVELEQGQIASYTGNYTDYLETKAVRMEGLAHSERSRQNLLRRELAWVRKQPQGRQAKSRAREEAYYELADQEGPLSADEMQLKIPTGDVRLGRKILELGGVRKSLGGRLLIGDLTLGLVAGDRIGVVGANGLGKTTLMRMIQGLEPPDGGTIEVGSNTRYVYADQGRERLDLTKSLIEEVAFGGGYMIVEDRQITTRNYLRRFLFSEDQQDQPLHKFSGGEQNRAQLAKLLAKGGNVLILDEPTNDLDLSTLRALEEALIVFSGCAFVVSHDRYFLNRVATGILAFEGDGRVTYTVGNYDRYLAQRETPEVPVPTKPMAVAVRSTTQAVRKLTFKETHELANLPAAIEVAEEGLAACESQLADPALYAGADVAGAVPALLAETADLRIRVEILYKRWEELEALKAAAEGVRAG